MTGNTRKIEMTALRARGESRPACRVRPIWIERGPNGMRAFEITAIFWLRSAKMVLTALVYVAQRPLASRERPPLVPLQTRQGFAKLGVIRLLKRTAG